MSDAFAGRRKVPRPENDPNLTYAPGTPARAELKARLAQMAAETVEIPVVIGGKEITGGSTERVVMPHKHAHVLGNFHKATPDQVRQVLLLPLGPAQCRRDAGARQTRSLQAL